MFGSAVLLHNPAVVYYQLMLRQEPRISRVAPALLEQESRTILCIGDKNLIQPQPLESCGPLQK